MDKSREVRRSLNRPKKKLISGSEESRKEKKVRRLSSVAEMGSEGGAEEDEPRKFKFPRKIFGDSNTVDPASVPRKLRSAIRKRGCESGSVALPKTKKSNNLLNGVEPPKMESSKKSKISTIGCLDHSLKRVASVPISKDEEEVAATLFALAGMIPLSDLCTEKSMDDEASGAKASDLAEKHGPKEEQEVACLSSAEVAIATPTTNSLASNSVQKESLIGPAPLTWPQLSERRPINLNLKVSVPPVSLKTILPLLQTCDQQPSFNSAFFHTSIGPSTESGLNVIKQEKTFIPNSESVIRTREVDVENQHATLMERGFNGGPSRGFYDSGVNGLKQSSAINFPSWVSTDTLSSRLGTSDLSTNKPSFSNRRTSWKRCAAHVYISHLIRVLQISEEKESRALETRHLGQFRTLSRGLITADHSNSFRNKANGLLPITSMFNSSDYKNFHDCANVISANHRHRHQEQQESSSFSGYSGSKQQNFDFLSLSSGVTPAADSGVNRLRNNLQSGANGHVLHQHSVAQDSRPQPFPSAQNHFPSSHCCDQVAPVSLGPLPHPPQGSLQISQYFGHPFAPAHMFNATTSAQQPQSKHQQLQLQQRQQIWTTQLAAQFRSGPLLSPHIMNWQKGKKDLQSSIYTESLNPSSQPSEELRAKYLHISQQQPQLIALGQSLGPNKSNHQHSQLPSIGEDNANQFHPNGVLPLQLTLQ